MAEGALKTLLLGSGLNIGDPFMAQGQPSINSNMDRIRLAEWLGLWLRPNGYAVREHHDDEFRSIDSVEIEIDPQPLFDCIEDQLGNTKISPDDQEQVSHAIEQVITVTGDRQDAFSSRARDYVVMQWAMSALGLDALAILRSLSTLFVKRNLADEIQEEVFGPTKGLLGIWKVPRLTPGSRSGRKCRFQITDRSIQFIGDTLRLLAWIVTSFRIPYEGRDVEQVWPLQPLSTKTCLYFGNDNPRLTIQVHPEWPQLIEPRAQQPRGSCWNRIFRHFPVATSFPIPVRWDNFAGVEAPLNLVTALAQIDYPLQYMEGFVLKGNRTALIPLKQTNVDGKVTQIQWHLVESESTNDCPLSMILVPEPSQLLSIASLDDFFKLLSDPDTRHFVGLYENATLNIGTCNSDGVEPPSVIGFPGVTSRSEGASTGWQGILSPTIGISTGVVNLGVSAPFKPAEAHLPRRVLRSWDGEGTMATMVDSACQSLTLLYDVGAKTAWLIPEICAVFYLLKAVLAREASTNTAHTNTPIRFPESDQIGLGLNESKRVCRDFIRTLPREHQGTLIQFLKGFQELKEDVCLKSRGQRSILRRFMPGQKSDRLSGVDLRQVVDRGRKYAVLEVQINRDNSGRWVELLQANWKQANVYTKKGGDGVIPEGLKVVSLFCGDLTGSQPIAPSPGTMRCRNWSPVPQGRDYLITTVQSLRRLTQLYPADKSKISPVHCFVLGHISPFNFASCENGERGCKRLQGILDPKQDNADGLPHKLQEADDFLQRESSRGVSAIVFGDAANYPDTSERCRLVAHLQNTRGSSGLGDDRNGFPVQGGGEDSRTSSASPNIPQHLRRGQHTKAPNAFRSTLPFRGLSDNTNAGTPGRNYQDGEYHPGIPGLGHGQDEAGVSPALTTYLPRHFSPGQHAAGNPFVSKPSSLKLPNTSNPSTREHQVEDADFEGFSRIPTPEYEQHQEARPSSPRYSFQQSEQGHYRYAAPENQE